MHASGSATVVDLIGGLISYEASGKLKKKKTEGEKNCTFRLIFLLAYFLFTSELNRTMNPFYDCADT